MPFLFKNKGVVCFFGEASQMEAWLLKDQVVLSEDFGLLASEEKEVIPHIISKAKSSGVATEGIVDNVIFKKIGEAVRSGKQEGRGRFV